MVLSKYTVCLSTSKPSLSMTPNGGGGSLTLLDPTTGSILSSLRSSADLSGAACLGMNSLSSFPPSFYNHNINSGNTQLVVAYGANTVKKGDTYAMLVSVRSPASLPPIQHWKGRLPETDMTAGLQVSKCGHYVVGGGSSGTCYVWSTIGGHLLRSFQAHYRACTCLAWSDCGRYLITGGADAMVHLFLLMDLVDKKERQKKVNPLETWSGHYFPITCLEAMDSGRMASAADDGQVFVWELFSKDKVASIKLPHGIGCMTFYNGRLYAGSTHGTIYSVDFSSYAMHQTEVKGASLTKRQRLDRQQLLTAAEQVFGKTPASSDNDRASTAAFQLEWIGHEHPVMSIAFLKQEDGKELLISGDDLGQVRIWAVESRICLHVLQPWSSTNQALGSTVTTDTSQTKDGDKKRAGINNNNNNNNKHPVTSIIVLPPQASDNTIGSASTSSSSMFGASSNNQPSKKGQTGMARFVTPLQRYPQNAEENHNDDTSSSCLTIPFLCPEKTSDDIAFWQARTMSRRFQRKQASKTTNREEMPPAAQNELAEDR